MLIKSCVSHFVIVILMYPILFSPGVALGNSPQPSPPSFTTLQPGGFRNIQLDLPINIVFIGFEPGTGVQQINDSRFRSGLPNTYRPLNRIPSLYGNQEFTGLTYNYDHNLVYANSAFEDAFFTYMSSIAQPQPRTIYQNIYNEQNTNAINVGQNHWIDAPSVEKWLANNSQAM